MIGQYAKFYPRYSQPQMLRHLLATVGADENCWTMPVHIPQTGHTYIIVYSKSQIDLNRCCAEIDRVLNRGY